VRRFIRYVHLRVTKARRRIIGLALNHHRHHLMAALNPALRSDP
jgi:hypothetical protein